MVTTPGSADGHRFDYELGVEHYLGKSWHDGKLIFRRVVQFDTFVADVSTAAFTEHTVIDTLIGMSASLASAIAFVQFFGSGGGSNGLQIFFATDEIIAHHFGFTATSGHCILEYTKT